MCDIIPLGAAMAVTLKHYDTISFIKQVLFIIHAVICMFPGFSKPSLERSLCCFFQTSLRVHKWGTNMSYTSPITDIQYNIYKYLNYLKLETVPKFTIKNVCTFVFCDTLFRI